MGMGTGAGTGTGEGRGREGKRGWKGRGKKCPPFCPPTFNILPPPMG